MVVRSSRTRPTIYYQKLGSIKPEFFKFRDFRGFFMRIHLTLALLSAILPAYAADQPPPAVLEVPPISDKIAGDSGENGDIPAAVTDSVNSFLKEGKKPSSISHSVVTGLYEVVVGSEVFYVSADGLYAVVGDIRDSKTGDNVTDSKRAELRIKELEKVDEKDTVVFTPAKETKYTVNVFTDVDCGYCAKFHQGIEELGNLGVKVRYLAFPRAGIGSKTYETMESVWCSDDRQKAMTDAKANREVPIKKCNNPLKDQYELGQRIGVRGTPALLLSDGELLPGYVPPQQLVDYLANKAKEKEGISKDKAVETTEVAKESGDTNKTTESEKINK
jgi:thiol:disulfide interchange protein DsbC